MLHAALGEHTRSDALPVDEATQAATVPEFPVEIMVDTELSPPIMLADSPMALPRALSEPDNSTAGEQAAKPVLPEPADQAEGSSL